MTDERSEGDELLEEAAKSQGITPEELLKKLQKNASLESQQERKTNERKRDNTQIHKKTAGNRTNPAEDQGRLPSLAWSIRS